MTHVSTKETVGAKRFRKGMSGAIRKQRKLAERRRREAELQEQIDALTHQIDDFPALKPTSDCRCKYDCRAKTADQDAVLDLSDMIDHNEVRLRVSA